MRTFSSVGMLILVAVSMLGVGHSGKLFRDRNELISAADAYIDMDERLDEVIQTYGLIEDWDVSKVTNFGALFSFNRNSNAANFQADLSRWNVSSARILHDMFLGAASFDSDVGDWDVGRVRRFNSLFYGATNFGGKGLEKWNVSSGTLFMSMFSDTLSLRQDLDIRHWNLENAERMVAMFRGSNFGGDMDTNDLCGWADRLRSSTNTYAMFLRSDCPYTSDPQLQNYRELGTDFCVRCSPVSPNQTEETPPTIAFGNNEELFVAVDKYLARDQEQLDVIFKSYGPIENWDVSQITNFGALFSRLRNPNSTTFEADVSRWDVGNARMLHDMFLGATSFDSDLSKWNVGRVTRFNGLFYGATSFTGQGLEHWNVSSGRLFMSMLSDTTSLRPDLDLTEWDVRNAENMAAMFRGSTSFGGDVDVNSLCAWVTRVQPNVNTRAMFLRTGCPYTTDPELRDVATGFNFCSRCPLTPTNGGEASESPRPNVLLIMTDQQRFDAIRRVQDELSRYNNTTKIRTPNLDRLSRMGAYFRTAYCQCSVCAPARASLRTGCTVERTGIQHNELSYEYVNSPLFTERVENLDGLDQVLQKLGYLSEYYGKWHLPNTLYKTADQPSGAIQYNDFDHETSHFFFRADS